MNLINLPLSRIDEPHIPDRQSIDDDALHALTASIAEYGILQPLAIRADGDRYEVIAGHRRLLAARRLNLEYVPCMLTDPADYARTRAMRATENLARSDLTPIEESVLVHALLAANDGDVRTVANAIHRSRPWVEARIQISYLPDDIREDLAAERLPLGHALALGEIPDEHHRRHLADSVHRAGATLGVLRGWISEWKLAIEHGDTSYLPTNITTTATGEMVVMVRCATCGEMHEYSHTMLVRACSECAKQLLSIE